MNAKELRIGNIVFDFGGRKSRITAITERGTIKVSGEYYRDESFNLNERVIAPIPLTEEWLVRFGFGNSKRTDRCFEKGANIVVSTADGKFRFITGNFVCQLVLKEIEHVHQLQNLYFALTGEELELKEK